MNDKKYRGPMSMHMCMNLETALDMAYCRNGWGQDGFYKIRDILGMPDGTKQSEITSELEQMVKDGMTAIPSEGCDNHKAGHCQGHVKRGINASKVHA